MPYYAERLRTTLVGRTGDWMARTGWPTTTHAAVLALVGAAVYAVDVELLAGGVRTMSLRYPLAFLVGYAVYFLALTFWRAASRDADREALLDGSGAEIATKPPFVGVDQDSARGAVRSMNDATVDNGLGFLMCMVAGIMLFGGVIVALFRLGYTQWYIGELWVLSGKVQYDSDFAPPVDPWPVAFWRQTRWLLLLLLLHYALLGWMCQTAVPDAVSFEGFLNAFRPAPLNG